MARILIPANSTRDHADYNRRVEQSLDDLALEFRRVRDVTASGTVRLMDATLVANAASGAITLTLPLAKDAKGRMYHIVKTDATANAVTIDGNGSETINGAATKSTTTQWAGWTIQSTGTAWLVIT